MTYRVYLRGPVAAACTAAAIVMSSAAPAAAEAPAVLDLSSAEPIPVTDLHAAVFAWKDQEVTLGGYLKGNMRFKRVTSRIGLAAAPGQEIGMAECEMANASNERLEDDPPVIVRGTIAHFSTANPDRRPRVHLRNCEIVSVGESFDERAPAALGSAQPVPVGALHDAMTGWFGKEVSVVGYFHGSTHSSASNKTRVDLKANDAATVLVGCHIPGEGVMPQTVVDDRAGVVMRGTLSEPTRDGVVLENCSFLNRQ